MYVLWEGEVTEGAGEIKENVFFFLHNLFFLFNFHSFIPFFAHFISHSQNILCFLLLFPQFFCFVLPTSFNKDLRQHSVFFLCCSRNSFWERFISFHPFICLYLETSLLSNFPSLVTSFSAFSFFASYLQFLFFSLSFSTSG